MQRRPCQLAVLIYGASLETSLALQQRLHCCQPALHVMHLHNKLPDLGPVCLLYALQDLELRPLNINLEQVHAVQALQATRATS